MEVSLSTIFKKKKNKRKQEGEKGGRGIINAPQKTTKILQVHNDGHLLLGYVTCPQSIGQNTISLYTYLCDHFKARPCRQVMYMRILYIDFASSCIHYNKYCSGYTYINLHVYLFILIYGTRVTNIKKESMAKL